MLIEVNSKKCAKNIFTDYRLTLDYPIVAMYRYENKQLFKINFAVFSSQALTSFSHDSNHYKLLYRQQKHEEQELVTLIFNYFSRN